MPESGWIRSQMGVLSDVLRRVARAQPSDPPEAEGPPPDLFDQALALLAVKGEASRLAAASRLLDALTDATPEARRACFERVAAELGPDDAAVAAAIEAWTPGDVVAARALHFAAEPRAQPLIRALNTVPGATARVVALRAEILDYSDVSEELKGLDADFRHLFRSWFNRGFLEIRRIDWFTPASVLEKIIRHEAVHAIRGWDDLRQRVGDPDRRLFAFFHPAMPAEPLIFVEVALTAEVPGAIGPILDRDRAKLAPDAARTAVFYSISNCQKGLRGISFGNFLIKQVVAELQRELPGLTTFVTLSPVPGLRRWAARAVETGDPLLSEADREALRALGPDETPDDALIRRVAARYLVEARRANGAALDPVAHFHLGNGATLHRVHAGADASPRGMENSWGVMVNYAYDGARIEINHQTYTTGGRAVAPEVRDLAEP